MSAISREYVKKCIWWTLNLAGANSLFRRKYREDICIFMLHGIADYDLKGKWTPLRERMDVRKFRYCIETLRKQYAFIPLVDAIDILRGKRPPVQNGAVLTFDDGYRNNFTVALPVLRELNIPATFYLVSGLVENDQPFWFDRADYAIQSVSPENLEIEVAGRTFLPVSDSRQAVSDLYSELRSYCKRTFRAEREFIIAIDDVSQKLERISCVSLCGNVANDQWAEVIGVEEIESFSSDELVHIGSHTVSHTRLSCSNETQIREELSVSKEKISKWCGHSCEHFAYPNGDHDSRSIAAVEEAGYLSAVTTIHGLNEIGSDVYSLKRVSIGNSLEGPELLATASGLKGAVMRFLHKSDR